jgi:hypothetical protein
VARSPDPVRRELDRALPGPVVDRLRDGVPAAELISRGDNAVYRALISSAASAVQRGWDCWEWQELVLEPKNVLAQQARLKKGRRPRSNVEMTAYLDKVWEKATAWASEAPTAWSRDEAAAEVERRISALTAVLEEPECGLLGPDRRILAYACERAAQLGTTRVALPKLATAAAAGLGEKSTKNSLNRLHQAGLLVLVEQGRPGGPSSRKRKANLYELADAERAASYLYRGTRSVGPPAQDCGTPPRPDSGTPAQDCGTPASTATRSAASPACGGEALQVPEQRADARGAAQPDPGAHNNGREVFESGQTANLGRPETVGAGRDGYGARLLPGRSTTGRIASHEVV